MANDQNLRPVTTRTKSEAREISRNGGIASGKKRREQKSAREMMKLICSMPVDDLTSDTRDALKKVGVKPTEQNMQAAILLAQALLARSGTQNSTKAAEFVMKMAGEMPADKLETVNQNYNLPTGITVTFVDPDENKRSNPEGV